jgi:para-aminobenzoate synthetase component 1
LSDFVQVQTVHSWVEPLMVACGLRDQPGLLCLLSDGEQKGRVSWIGAGPDRVHVIEADDGTFRAFSDPDLARHVVGLASYDAGARVATGPRDPVWPDLILARYPALLRFDHDRQQVTAVGLGSDTTSAGRAARVRRSSSSTCSPLRLVCSARLRTPAVVADTATTCSAVGCVVVVASCD